MCKLGLLLFKLHWDYQIYIWKKKRKWFWSPSSKKTSSAAEKGDDPGDFGTCLRDDWWEGLSEFALHYRRHRFSFLPKRLCAHYFISDGWVRVCPEVTSRVPGEMASARTSLAVSIFMMVIAGCISEETCERDDTCSCKFKNGSIVNLKPADGGDSPKLVKMKVIWFCLQKTISGSHLIQNNSDLVFQTRTIFLKWVSSWLVTWPKCDF